jgi:hypothetical protein
VQQGHLNANARDYKNVLTGCFKGFPNLSATNAVWALYEIQTMQNPHNIRSANCVTVAASTT